MATYPLSISMHSLYAFISLLLVQCEAPFASVHPTLAEGVSGDMPRARPMTGDLPPRADEHL